MAKAKKTEAKPAPKKALVFSKTIWIKGIGTCTAGQPVSPGAEKYLRDNNLLSKYVG